MRKFILGYAVLWAIVAALLGSVLQPLNVGVTVTQRIEDSLP